MTFHLVRVRKPKHGELQHFTKKELSLFSSDEKNTLPLHIICLSRSKLQPESIYTAPEKLGKYQNRVAIHYGLIAEQVMRLKEMLGKLKPLSNGETKENEELMEKVLETNFPNAAQMEFFYKKTKKKIVDSLGGKCVEWLLSAPLEDEKKGMIDKELNRLCRKINRLAGEGTSAQETSWANDLKARVFKIGICLKLVSFLEKGGWQQYYSYFESLKKIKWSAAQNLYEKKELNETRDWILENRKKELAQDAREYLC